MQFGICTAIDNLERFADTGIDFIEVNSGAVASKTGDAFAEVLTNSKRFPNMVRTLMACLCSLA